MIAKFTAVLLCVFSIFLWAAVAQHSPADKTPAFNPKAYPSSSFSVTRQDYDHGEVTVRITQAKSKEPRTEPHFCRAWLEIRKANVLLKRLYYADIEPVGFSYGIFVPREQPLPQYFIAVKEGDYDGRLLLVTKDGSLINLPGGFYFLTANKRYLVGEYASDDAVLLVVDVDQRKVIIDGRKDRQIPMIMNWYHDSSGYFFTEAGQSGAQGTSQEKKDHAYRLDFEHLRILRFPITDKQLAASHKVAYDFDPRQKEDCTAKRQ